MAARNLNRVSAKADLLIGNHMLDKLPGLECFARELAGTLSHTARDDWATEVSGGDLQGNEDTWSIRNRARAVPGRARLLRSQLLPAGVRGAWPVGGRCSVQCVSQYPTRHLAWHALPDAAPRGGQARALRARGAVGCDHRSAISLSHPRAVARGGVDRQQQ